MNKKGFTLIELLAVIVILAIIALIATPIVLNIIKDSKENAQLRSTEFYLDGVEQVITKKMMNDATFKVSECEIQKDGNLKCDGKTDVIEIEVSGEKPSSGKICLSSKGIVDKVMVKYSNYYVSHDRKDTKITDKDTFDSFSCNSGIGNVLWSGTVDDFVYNDDVEGYLASLADEFPNIGSGLYKIKVNENILDCSVMSDGNMTAIMSQGNPKTYLIFNKAQRLVISLFPIEESISLEIIESENILDYVIYIEPFIDDGRSEVISANFYKNVFEYESSKDFVFEMRDSKDNLIYTPSSKISFGYEEDREMYYTNDNGMDREIYDALQNSIDNNEPITFIFTQTLETGKVITKKVSGVPVIRTDLINYEDEAYYCWGNVDAFILGE